jgi:hypothetical protein
MGGARSGMNYTANQAPDINCRSTSSSFGGWISGPPGQEGAAGTHNDCITLIYRTDSIVFRIQFDWTWG